MNSLLFKNSIVSRSILPPAKSKTIAQPKLSINVPGDQYEQEADEMAERVMQRPANENNYRPKTGIIGASLQRKCTECEEEEKRRKLIMRKAEGSSSGIQASTSFASSLNASKGGGSPLPQGTKSFMENAFSTDFSSVRIHADSQASEMSNAINARAFTYGNDIYFNNAEFILESNKGKKLLAHELMHVVQNNNNILTKQIQRLGANNGCNVPQRNAIHQAIYDARGWINNMLKKVNANPNDPNIIRALRRNFGSTYGVTANLPMIVNRIRRVYGLLTSNAMNCDSGTDPLCVSGFCGFTVAGSLLSIICPHTITSGGNYLIGCVLHEAFHAAYTNFTVDEYSGWHGAATGTPGYPGPGVEPLLNADSYTSFVIDLS